MKILLIGAQGQLGKALAKALPDALVYDGDVRNHKAMLSAISAHRPDYVINTTAYTDVDQAESSELEALKAFDINCKAVYVMAVASYNVDAAFVHFSTVYCGAENLLSTYAASKSLGERVALGASPNTLIIRTDCLFSETTGFVGKVMDNVNNDKKVILPLNLCGNPTHVNYLVAETLKLIDKGAIGTVTVVGDAYLSRYDWALRFVPKDKHYLIGSKVLFDKDSIRKLDNDYHLKKGNHK